MMSVTLGPLEGWVIAFSLFIYIYVILDSLTYSDLGKGNIAWYTLQIDGFIR